MKMGSNVYDSFDAERLMAIHRQYIRAEAMKKRFDELLPISIPDFTDKAAFGEYFISDANTNMYTWYGYLYSVLEATRDGIIKHFDTSLDAAAADERVCTEFDIPITLYKNWRKLRNTTFHVRSDYYDMDMFQALAEPNAGKIIRAAHAAVGSRLLQSIQNRQAGGDNGK
jgi:hypothetical protein